MNKLVAILVLGVVGCTQPIGLQHTSSLTHTTRGVALVDGGAGAAGMNSMVCGFDVLGGWVFSDWRTDPVVEHVVDRRARVVMAAAPTGLWEIDLDGGALETQLSEAGDVVAAGWLFDQGDDRFVVRGTPSACQVELGGASYAVDGALCGDGASFAVDRATGSVWAAAGALYQLDAAGAHDTGRQIDRVAWNDTQGVLLAAQTGESDVIALDPSGAEVYTAHTDDPVVSIATLGTTASEAIVLTAPSNGVGRLHVVATTGEVVQTIDVPQPGDLVTNPSGSFLGIVVPGEVHFYAVDQDVPITAIMRPQPQPVQMFD